MRYAVCSCCTSVLHPTPTTASCGHLLLLWQHTCHEYLSRKSRLHQRRGQLHSEFYVILPLLSETAAAQSLCTADVFLT